MLNFAKFERNIGSGFKNIDVDSQKSLRKVWNADFRKFRYIRDWLLLFRAQILNEFVDEIKRDISKKSRSPEQWFPLPFERIGHFPDSPAGISPSSPGIEDKWG